MIVSKGRPLFVLGERRGKKIEQVTKYLKVFDPKIV